MPKGSVRVIRCLPNAQSRRRVLLDAGMGAFSAITCLSDGLGRPLSEAAAETGAGEFVSLSELAGRALDASGIPRGNALASERESLAALAAVCRNLPEDSPFKGSSAFAGFHRRLDRTLVELRLWKISVEQLLELAKGVPPHLSAKLGSLAWLMESQEGALEHLGKTFVENRIAKGLTSFFEPSASIGPVLIFAGSDDAPLYADWMKWLALQGVAVTVVVDHQASSAQLFEGARRLESLFAGHPKSVNEGNPLCRNLFAPQPSMGADFEVEIFSAADPLAEVEWALRRVNAALAAGTSASSIGLFGRDLSAYGPMIEAAADRFGVPVRLSKRIHLSQSALCRLLRDATRQTLKLGADSQRGLETTSYWPSDSISVRSELAAWAERAPTAAGLSEWVGWWRGCLDFEWVRQARQTPSMTQTRDDLAAAALEEALLVHAMLEGQGLTSQLDAQRFLSLLNAAVDQEECALPAQGQGVLATSRPDELGSLDSLLVLGMLEGGFPRRRSEDPILSDFDRQAINALRPGKPELPDSHRDARGERDVLVRVCAAPSRRIAFSYPLTDDDRDNVPAFYLEEITRAMAGLVERGDHPRAQLTPPIENCAIQADRELCTALDSRSRPGPPAELFSDLAKAAVAPLLEDPLSPSELRDALHCGFKSAFRRGLKLDPKRMGLTWTILLALPQRVGLPAIAGPEEAKERLKHALEAQVLEHAHELSEGDLKLLRIWGSRLIKEWVGREFEARELWQKDPGSVRPHAAFGEEGLRGELPLPGRSLRLRGAATAQATMGPYAVVEILNARRSIAEAKSAEDLSDADAMELGVYLMALWGQRAAVAAEVESLSGDRTLFVLPRRLEQELAGKAASGMRVVDLGEPRSFLGRVKDNLSLALERIDAGAVAPSPGDHCSRCDFAELCRSAQGSGEEEGVTFASDVEA
ncbi:MAG: PD-(D/E)XK nuclease family protein [Armatimonadetes bacterium]|nr:PD-(D/E)XK nuclease family protein [Armatimonadota bacterium]